MIEMCGSCFGYQGMQLVCLNCGELFATERELQRHIQEEHGGFQ